MPKVRILTNTELETMRNVCENALEKAIFEFLRSTGCRVMEMLAVLKEDLTMKENKVFLRKTKARIVWSKRDANGERTYKKVMEPRVSLVDDKAVSALKIYFKTRSFRPKSRVFPRTDRAIRGMVKRWSKEGNIQRHEKIHPHTFRHTAATRMLAEDVPIPYIKQLLGWSKKSLTFETYYEHTPDDIVVNKALEKMRK